MLGGSEKNAPVGPLSSAGRDGRPDPKAARDYITVTWPLFVSSNVPARSMRTAWK